MQDWVRDQRIAMTIWYDPERSIRIWCLHEDDGLSFPYRLQKFPLFLSSSYLLQKFADTDRLRVNRRPIRKDFFPDRYDFVPIVFTSSSCKRGLKINLTAFYGTLVRKYTFFVSMDALGCAMFICSAKRFGSRHVWHDDIWGVRCLMRAHWVTLYLVWLACVARYLAWRR